MRAQGSLANVKRYGIASSAVMDVGLVTLLSFRFASQEIKRCFTLAFFSEWGLKETKEITE
jgi:hypothetical protein